MAFAILGAAPMCGVYKITNTQSAKFYIGSSVKLRARVRQHLTRLRRGVHVNLHLQASFRVYGEDAFFVEVLEECDVGSVLEREQHYIDTLRPQYNICPVAGRTTGYKHGPEALAKMSAASKSRPSSFLGCKHTDETRQKISQNRRGKKPSPEHIEKVRQASLGNKYTAGKKMPDGHAEKRRADMLAKWADPVWKAERLAGNRAARAVAAEAS